MRMKLATVVALAAVLSFPAQVLADNSCKKISGHISGQIIGPTPACGGGPTEAGSFTGKPPRTFLASGTRTKDHPGGVPAFTLLHTPTTPTPPTLTPSPTNAAPPII